MSSGPRYKNILSRIRSRKKEESSATTQTNDVSASSPLCQNDVTDNSSSSTPLMDVSESKNDLAAHGPQSDVTHTSCDVDKSSAKIVTRNNDEDYNIVKDNTLSQIPTLGTQDTHSPHHLTGYNDTDKLLSNKEKAQEPKSTSHTTETNMFSEPPGYSSLDWDKLAQLEPIAETQLGKDYNQGNNGDVTVHAVQDDVASNKIMCKEKEEKSLWDKSSLRLPNLEKNETSKAQTESIMTPGQKFISAAMAVKATVRINRMERAKRRAKWAGKKFLVFLLSHIGLTLVVLLYAAAGGFLFRWLEKDAESTRRTQMDFLRFHYLNRMWNETIRLNVLYPVDWAKNIGVILKDFERSIHEAISDGMWDGTSEEKWSIPGSLLFSTSVITSIGYGDITPKTTAGKLVCIPFAVVGIPLTLLCLANIGKLMAGCFTFAWQRLTQCHRCLTSRSRDKKTKGKKTKVRVPVSISLFIVLAYTILGAVIFSKWEDGWSFLDGLYFSFVTLSTIGFGDLVPGQYVEGTNERRVVCTVYVFLGLSLLSMVFQLMIDTVNDMMGKYAKFFGLSDEQIQGEIQEMKEPATQVPQGPLVLGKVSDASMPSAKIVDEEKRGADNNSKMSKKKGKGGRSKVGNSDDGSGGGKSEKDVSGGGKRNKKGGGVGGSGSEGGGKSGGKGSGKGECGSSDKSGKDGGSGGCGNECLDGKVGGKSDGKGGNLDGRAGDSIIQIHNEKDGGGNADGIDPASVEKMKGKDAKKKKVCV